MAELTVPQIDFSSLGQLPQIWKQGQQDALRQQTLANLGNGTATPQDITRAGIRLGDLQLAGLGINQQNTEYQHGRDLVGDQRWAITDKRAANADARAGAAEGRAAKDWEKTPDQYVPNPNAGQPGQPQYIDQYAQATAAAGGGKPIPYETLGGTRFLMPQPGGGYTNVDPGAIAPASPSQPAPAGAPVPSGAGPSPSAAVPAPNPAAPSPPTADLEAVDPKTGRREGYLGSLDPQIQGYIKKVADYEIDPRTTSVKGGMREKLMSAVAKYDPTYNQNEFGARSKATRDFSTGPQGNSVRSFDVAIDHLNTLEGYVKALNNGDTRIINSIRNKWREANGSELPTNVQAVGPVVGAEVTKAIVGSNNALADREELRKPLGGSGSLPQIQGAIGAYKELMAGQLKGLKKQYEDTTGKKDFDSRVRQGTRDVLLGPKKEPVVIDGYTITEH